MWKGGGRMGDENRTPEERESALTSFLGPFVRILKVFFAVAAVAVVIFGIVYAVSCIPRSVFVEFDGVRYHRSAPEDVTSVHIRMSGKMKQKWFRYSEFDGVLTLSPSDEKPVFYYHLFLYPQTGTAGADFIHAGGFLYDFGPGYHSFIGLWTDPSFSYMVLRFSESTGSNVSATFDLVLTAPAKSSEEGERLILEKGLPIGKEPNPEKSNSQASPAQQQPSPEPSPPQ
jgi:hypothetical protein